jgi:hypothetical protein
MEKKKVMGGRLLNHQPDGENIIKKISRVKKEMREMDKINTMLKVDRIKNLF